MIAYRTKEFLTDLGNGVGSEELMRKYKISKERLEQICRVLRRSDLAALRRLWELDKLSDTQFMRAFAEVEKSLNSDD